MKKYVKQLWVLMFVVWGGVGALSLYNQWRMDVFREGYLHGARHAEIYFKQKGKFPPMQWQIEAFRFVNDEDWWPVEVVGTATP